MRAGNKSLQLVQKNDIIKKFRIGQITVQKLVSYRISLYGTFCMRPDLS